MILFINFKRPFIIKLISDKSYFLNLILEIGNSNKKKELTQNIKSKNAKEINLNSKGIPILLLIQNPNIGI